MKSLESAESSYHFETAKSRDALIHEVETGEAQCGFIVNEGFSEQLEKGEQSKLLTYVNSSFTTKGAGAKETVFATLYRTLAGNLLKEQSSTIYDSNDPALLKGLDQWYHHYLDSDEVFRISYHSIAPRGGVTSAVTDAAAKSREPVLSMALILLFFQLFLAEAGKGSDGAAHGPACGLPGGERMGWEFCSNLGEVFLPAVFMAAAIFCLENPNFSLFDSQGHFLSHPELGEHLLSISSSNGLVSYSGKIIASAALTLILSDFWVIVFRRLVRSHMSYLCWSFTILTAEMILCPVFWNPGSYFPFLSLAGCVFPPGLVLMVL